jgi:hypothetical protein
MKNALSLSIEAVLLDVKFFPDTKSMVDERIKHFFRHREGEGSSQVQMVEDLDIGARDVAALKCLDEDPDQCIGWRFVRFVGDLE